MANVAPKKLVTILIDTYNHEKYIEQAITSVLGQNISGYNVEILVIDDGSTDRTSEIIKRYNPKIHYFHKQNGGQASSFNFGISRARGEIIAFLDGDDWWKEEKLQTILEVFEQYPHAGTVGHGYVEFYDSGREREVAPPETVTFRLNNTDDARVFKERCCFLGTSLLATRNKVLRNMLPIPEELIIAADGYIFTILPVLTEVVILPSLLTYYRLHDNNLYQFRDHDDIKLKRKLSVTQALLSVLPDKLREEDLSEHVIDVLLEPNRIAAERVRLSVYGGRSRDTYNVEKTVFHMNARSTSMKQKMFKCFVLMLVLLLPPRLFYRLRNLLYSAGNRIHS